jgi:ABC-type uncharacterized transport system permease subunit
MIRDIFTVSFIAGLIGATIRMASPIMFVTFGEILSECAGVLNLGI